jgi:hypothetical protein
MNKPILALLLIGLLACSSDMELKKSIFISDPDAPELPEYSEWGYNTFGAYYDRQPFISNDRDVPVKVIYQDSKTSFVFTGQKGVDYYYNENQFAMTLTVPDFHPLTPDDLISLNEITFDLSDPKYQISMAGDTSPYPVKVLNGTFQIKRAQRLLVDNKAEEVILSGVFEFQALINGNPVTVSLGRFDVGVGRWNFFIY